jgi:hypothetical protein
LSSSIFFVRHIRLAATERKQRAERSSTISRRRFALSFLPTAN